MERNHITTKKGNYLTELHFVVDLQINTSPGCLTKQTFFYFYLNSLS